MPLWSRQSGRENQVVNREDEGSETERGRIESRREEHRRPSPENLGGEPERAGGRERPRPLLEAVVLRKPPQDLVRESPDAVGTGPAGVGEDG